MEGWQDNKIVRFGIKFTSLFIIALNLSKFWYLFQRNIEFFKIILIPQPNKNADDIKRRWTKLKKKRRMEQNIEWKKC